VQALDTGLQGVLGVELDAVAGAFEEIGVRLRWISAKRIKRIDKRPLHQAVDEKPMPVGIDVWDTAVQPDMMQAIGRDRAFEKMQRRADRAGAGRRIAGRFIPSAAHDAALIT
jgi:hypothetical protein